MLCLLSNVIYLCTKDKIPYLSVWEQGWSIYLSLGRWQAGFSFLSFSVPALHTTTDICSQLPIFNRDTAIYLPLINTIFKTGIEKKLKKGLEKQEPGWILFTDYIVATLNRALT